MRCGEIFTSIIGVAGIAANFANGATDSSPDLPLKSSSPFKHVDWIKHSYGHKGDLYRMNGYSEPTAVSSEDLDSAIVDPPAKTLSFKPPKRERREESGVKEKEADLREFCHLVSKDEELREAMSRKKAIKYLKNLCRDISERDDCDTGKEDSRPITEQEKKTTEEQASDESQQPENGSDWSVSLANIRTSLADVKSFLVDFQSAAGQNSSHLRDFLIGDLTHFLADFRSDVGRNNTLWRDFGRQVLTPFMLNVNHSLSRIESSVGSLPGNLTVLINGYKDMMASLEQIKTDAENGEATCATSQWMEDISLFFSGVAMLATLYTLYKVKQLSKRIPAQPPGYPVQG